MVDRVTAFVRAMTGKRSNYSDQGEASTIGIDRLSAAPFVSPTSPGQTQSWPFSFQQLPAAAGRGVNSPYRLSPCRQRRLSTAMRNQFEPGPLDSSLSFRSSLSFGSSLRMTRMPTQKRINGSIHSIGAKVRMKRPTTTTVSSTMFIACRIIKAPECHSNCLEAQWTRDSRRVLSRPQHFPPEK